MSVLRLPRLAPPAALLAAAAAALPADLPPGRARPVFRGGVDVVHLHVTVTDKADRHVSGLDRRDFIVYEDGVPQEVTLFDDAGAPISLVLMIDSSGSMYDALPAVRAAASRVVDVLREQDRARLVSFNGRDTILQDFTSDHHALRAALGRVEASGATALYKAVYVALKDLAREKAGAESRRLGIVLLSDGLDTASTVSDEQLLELARGSEVSIYPVALRPGRRQASETAAFSEANYFLSRLASETGGRAFFADSVAELDGAYARIAAEVRAQYSLAYSPLGTRGPGWRRIQVRAVGRDGLQVRHRRGYYARAR